MACDCLLTHPSYSFLSDQILLLSLLASIRPKLSLRPSPMALARFINCHRSRWTRAAARTKGSFQTPAELAQSQGGSSVAALPLSRRGPSRRADYIFSSFRSRLSLARRTVPVSRTMGARALEGRGGFPCRFKSPAADQAFENVEVSMSRRAAKEPNTFG